LSLSKLKKTHKVIILIIILIILTVCEGKKLWEKEHREEGKWREFNLFI